MALGGGLSFISHKPRCLRIFFITSSSSITKHLTSLRVSNCNRRQLYRHLRFHQLYPTIVGICPHNFRLYRKASFTSSHTATYTLMKPNTEGSNHLASNPRKNPAIPSNKPSNRPYSSWETYYCIEAGIYRTNRLTRTACMPFPKFGSKIPRLLRRILPCCLLDPGVAPSN